MAIHARGMVLVLCTLLAVAQARVLTRGELAPLLAKKVVIPNAAKAPRPTPWPEEFTIAFTTDDGAAAGELYYDWGNRRQVMVHGQGSSHCKMRGSAGVCYVLENARGTFEVDPVGRKCEVTSQWGSVPPSWAASGVFAGVVGVNGLKCNKFDYPPSMHSWLETVDGGEFCAFTFPFPSLNYIFAPATLKLEKPASSIFIVPDYCPQDHTPSEETSLKAIL